jgi:hypothetical protein
MNPISVTDALNRLFQAMNNSFWVPFLLAVAGLGSLTMAILQAVKDTTPVRQWFQKHQLTKWLKEHAEEAKKNGNGSPSWCEAMNQIVLLSTNGDPDAFFSLEIEKLCGQWSAGAQIVLDSPQEYPDFFSCVAALSRTPDYEKVFGRAFPVPMLPNLEAKLDEHEQKQRLAARQSFIDARTRVAHQIQRAIDAFQIETAFRWKLAFQVASYFLSFALAASAMAIGTPSNTHLSQTIAQTIIWSAVAGFLAPIARDLLAVVQKLRSPT